MVVRMRHGETIFIVWCIIFISHQSIADAYNSVIVHTKYGDVEGYETDLTRVFYGIPYAQPPVNTLRYDDIVFSWEFPPVVLLIDGRVQYP